MEHEHKNCHCHERCHCHLHTEDKNHNKKTIIKIILSVCGLLLSTYLPIREWLSIALYVLSALIIGYELIIDCFESIKKGSFFDETTLMLVASIVAMSIGEYIEATLVLIIFSIGEMLEHIATEDSKRKISSLANIKNDYVRIVKADKVYEAKPSEVEIGSIIEVRKGDAVVIDGELLSELAELDTKVVTGESKLSIFKRGDIINSGCINTNDVIRIKTTVNFKDSTVEKIISMVEGANSKKSKSHKFITSFARVYTPIVVVLAIILAVLPPFFDGMNFYKWIYKGLAFLLISCPCALVISVPLSYYIGIGSLSKQGILIKGSNYIDLLSKADTIVFDKTGTLTKGEFKVDKVLYSNLADKDKILDYVYSIENSSSHPLAKALCDYAIKNKASLLNIKTKEISGKGVIGYLDDKQILIGNSLLMKNINIKIPDASLNDTIIYVAIDGVLFAEFYLVDCIKEETIDINSSAKKVGVNRCIIFSGDNNKVVRLVASEARISEYYSNMLPQDKQNKLALIKQNVNNTLIFCGDGINDAPSIATADVGVAMGKIGSDVALESSDVAIMDDNPKKLLLAIKHSKKINRIVKQNIIGSMIVKITVMALSVFTSLPLWIANLSDVGVMIVAVLNSFRNYKIK